MTRDELEYSISQYFDGTLPPLEQTAIEQRLATDAEAREILAEFEKLDGALKASVTPLPVVDWVGLSARISAAVAQAEAPVRHYSFNMWVRAASKWAVAAVVLLAVGIVARNRFASAPDDDSPPPVATASSGARLVAVEGPQIESAPAPAVEVIAIGPSDALARGDLQWRYADGVVARPSSVVIYSSSARGQDSGTLMPY